MILLLLSCPEVSATIVGNGHRERDLTEAERTSVAQAIAMLAGIDEEVRTGLLDLLGEDGRHSGITREEEMSSDGAFAFTDSTKEASRADGIGIPSTVLGSHETVLAGTLVNQWDRLQRLANNRLPSGDALSTAPPHARRAAIEISALTREIAVTKSFRDQALGGGNSDLAEFLSLRIESLECRVAILRSNQELEAGRPSLLPVFSNCPMLKVPGDAPRFVVGHALRFQNPNGQGSVLAMDLQIDGTPIANSETPLPITYAQDMEVVRSATLSRGGWGVLVSGTNSTLNEGRIVGLEVFEFGVLSTVRILRIPGIIPERIVHDPATAQLYVLDTANDEVRMLTDGNGDGFPDTVVAQPFASAPTFPFLADVRSVFVRPPEGGGAGLLRLSQQATDARDVYYDMDDPQLEMIDDDGDGVANGATPMSYKESLVLAPTFSNRPQADDECIPVHATWGTTVRVLEVSTGDSLGEAVIDLEDPARDLCCSAIVNLSRPLVRGELIRVIDVVNVDAPPMTLVVGPPSQQFDEDPEVP